MRVVVGLTTSRLLVGSLGDSVGRGVRIHHSLQHS